MICMSFKTLVYPIRFFLLSASCTSRTVEGPRAHKILSISSSDTVGFCVSGVMPRNLLRRCSYCQRQSSYFTGCHQGYPPWRAGPGIFRIKSLFSGAKLSGQLNFWRSRFPVVSRKLSTSSFRVSLNSSAPNRFHKHLVIVLRLVSIRESESNHGFVKRVILSQIPCNLRRIASARMRPRQRPPAKFQVLDPLFFGHIFHIDSHFHIP